MSPGKLARAGLLLAAGPLLGCSAPADIYQEADAKFRAAVKQDALTGLLSKVHDRLGNVTDATRTGFNVNYNTGGSTIVLTYATKFQQGEGRERLVWLKSGDGLRLLNYDIRSAALDGSTTQ